MLEYFRYHPRNLKGYSKNGQSMLFSKAGMSGEGVTKFDSRFRRKCLFLHAKQRTASQTGREAQGPPPSFLKAGCWWWMRRRFTDTKPSAAGFRMYYVNRRSGRKLNWIIRPGEKDGQKKARRVVSASPLTERHCTPSHRSSSPPLQSNELLRARPPPSFHPSQHAVRIRM